MSMGVGSTAAAFYSLALGSGAFVGAESGIAIGDSAYIGIGNFGPGLGPIALGQRANASAYGVLSIGVGSTASAPYAISMGHISTALAPYAISIGMNSGAGAPYSVVIGVGGISGGVNGTDSVAIGRISRVIAAEAIALGPRARVSTDPSRPDIMQTALTEPVAGIAIGSGAQVYSPGAVALGRNAVAYSYDLLGRNVAIGDSALSADGSYMVALGANAAATGTGALTVGANSSAAGDYGVALGPQAAVTSGSSSGVAIGYRAKASAANTIVLNAQSTALAGPIANAFYVAPIRGIALSAPVLVYNTATKEITCELSSE
jgi:hypothetical protein